VRNKGDTQSDEAQSPETEPRFCLMRLCIPEACLSKGTHFKFVTPVPKHEGK